MVVVVIDLMCLAHPCVYQLTQNEEGKTQWKSKPKLTTFGLKVQVMGSSKLWVSKFLYHSAE